MVEWFDFAQVGVASGVWNPDKLAWLNQHYLKTLPPEVVAERILPLLAEKGFHAVGVARAERLVIALRERVKTLAELAQVATTYVGSGVTLDEDAARKHLGPASRLLLTE
jgi:glutamyl-tRNA synthetase